MITQTGTMQEGQRVTPRIPDKFNTSSHNSGSLSPPKMHSLCLGLALMTSANMALPVDTAFQESMERRGAAKPGKCSRRQVGFNSYKFFRNLKQRLFFSKRILIKEIGGKRGEDKVNFNSGSCGTGASQAAGLDPVPELFLRWSWETGTWLTTVLQGCETRTEDGKQTDGAGLAFPTQCSTISASYYKGAWKRGSWRGQKMLGTSRFASGQLLIITLHGQSCPSVAEGWCWAANVRASTLALWFRGCVRPLTFLADGRSSMMLS